MKIPSNKKNTDTVVVQNELSFFTENLNEAIFIGKLDGTILNYNSAAVELFGYNLQEFKKIKRQDIFDVPEKELITMFEKREEKGYIKVEIIGIKKNGERFFCEISSKVYKTKNGELRTSNYIRDISNRKKTEDNLSLIINLSEENFILTNKYLNLTSFNKQCIDAYLFHLNNDDVTGECASDSEFPEKRKQIQDLYNRVLNGEIIQTEIDILSKSITKQKNEQEAKVAIEAKFFTIIDSTSDLISLIDKNGNFLFINKALENIIGLTLDEIKGKPYDIVIHTDDKANVKLIFDDILKKPGESSARLKRILHKNGHYIWAEGEMTNLLKKDNINAVVSVSRDITKQKQVADQLKENEEKLKENLNQLTQLTNNIDAVVYQFEMSPDGKMTFPFMSNSILNLIPTVDVEILKKDSSSAFTSVHPDDVEGLIASIYESRNNLTDWNYQYRHVVDNGKEQWIKGSSKPTKKEDGTVVWYGYLLDITERVISDKKIKESNQRYDIIAKATNDTIWDRDLKTDKIIWNKGIQGIFGYKEDEPGISDGCAWWYSKIHPDDINQVRKKLEARISNKILRWEHEYRFLCADNTYKHVFDRGFIVLDANEVPIRMIGAMQDITNQKEEEFHLKLLESVITHTTDSVIITKINVDTHEEIIIYVNTAFIEMTGYSLEEIIGKNPCMFRGAKTNITELAKIKEAITNSCECQAEITNYKKNGEEFWVSMSISPVFNELRAATHFIAIEKDVTERKKKEIEKELLIAELSQSNKDLRHFSYVISHNLRAPIANLLGLTSLIDQYKMPNKSLKTILDGIKQSAVMFDDTLKDLTKILVIKDQTNIVKENISLTDTVNNIISQLSIVINDNQVKVSYDFNDAPMVYFTSAYLESIFLNLFTNAIKYKSPDRKLKIQISSTNFDGFVEIRFKDNGIGIDLNTHKEKLFKLYQRFHDHSEGKGLGLYLIKSQIDVMNGEINIESKVNVGTTFIIKFKK